MIVGILKHGGYLWLMNVVDEFLRIVLDEAHNIKNRTALVSKACYELKGQRRWALSGESCIVRIPRSTEHL
jgi:hypothetical protein